MTAGFGRSSAVSNVASAMYDADFIVIDDVVFETEYLRVPDEFTVGDDVVLEARHGNAEVTFTLDEVAHAEFLGDGQYRLRSGEVLQFLSNSTVH